MAKNKHPGFKAVSAKIAKNVKPRKGETKKEAADRILAASSRKASASAKRKNPRLRRVKG